VGDLRRGPRGAAAAEEDRYGGGGGGRRDYNGNTG
jgi:hypothetical protein